MAEGVVNAKYSMMDWEINKKKGTQPKAVKKKVAFMDFDEDMDDRPDDDWLLDIPPQPAVERRAAGQEAPTNPVAELLGRVEAGRAEVAEGTNRWTEALTEQARRAQAADLQGLAARFNVPIERAWVTNNPIGGGVAAAPQRPPVARPAPAGRPNRNRLR
jgi:hypothetical protein